MMHIDVTGLSQRDRRLFGPAIGFILLFNACMAALLLLKPVGHAWLVGIDDVAQAAGPIVASLACFALIAALQRSSRTDAGPHLGVAQRWAPRLLACGPLGFGVGQSIWTYYEQVLHQQTPFPSWADAGFLSAYPFMLLGVLLLSGRRTSLASHTRVFLDGVMVMTAVVTFSWYFVLGPTMLQGGESTFAKVVGTAYPLSDLVLISCVLILGAQRTDQTLRPVTHILSVAFGIIVATDSVFDYQTLHGSYATGTLVDVGWPLGYMIVGLAALVAAARLQAAAHGEQSESAVPVAGGSDEVRLWGSLVPYMLIPVVGALMIYALRTHGDELLEPGLIVGATTLTVLIIVRQILAIVESTSLYRRLRLNMDALAEANTRLEALATTDPLTNLPNHRSLMAALDHELERARRFHRPCSVVFLDLDHFKALNDGLGHSAGDAALRELGRIAREALRGIDILGRWGGEEFLAILPESGAEGAMEAGERVRAAVAGHAFGAGGGVRLTCSLGFATYPYDGEDRDTLIEMADRAMYAAKRLGRNQVRGVGDPAVSAFSSSSGTVGSREEAALMGTVEALSTLVDARDPGTGRHAQEVSILSMKVALALGLDASEAHMVGLAARLHDVGKVGVPDAVLQKQGQLTEDEWKLVRRHAVVGADVVNRVPALRVLSPLIRGHHERWDGQGYPDGLKGDDIPLGARILCPAEAYSAMTADRPYRQKRGPQQALEELRRCAGTQFDPDVVAVLERVLAAENGGQGYLRAV